MAEHATPVAHTPLRTALLLALILLVVAAIAGFFPPALQRTVTQAMIMLVVVTGLYTFCGNSGVFSFGHAI